MIERIRTGTLPSPPPDDLTTGGGGGAITGVDSILIGLSSSNMGVIIGRPPDSYSGFTKSIVVSGVPGLRDCCCVCCGA